METFMAFRDMVPNPGFGDQRRRVLDGLADVAIDAPIVSIVQHLNLLPFCFTLQSCYGHFLYTGCSDPLNCRALPATVPDDAVDYHIAYIAFCLDRCPDGEHFLDRIRTIVDIDPAYIQFGCAGWFWDQQVNSYVIQVEPARFKYQDTATLAFSEGLVVEERRRRFYDWLGCFC